MPLCSLGCQQTPALSSLCLQWRVAHGGRCMNMQQVASAHPRDHKHQLYVHAQMFADKHKTKDFTVILWCFAKISSSLARACSWSLPGGRGSSWEGKQQHEGGAEHKEVSVFPLLLCPCGCSAPGKRYVLCPTAFGTQLSLLLCMLAGLGEIRFSPGR